MLNIALHTLLLAVQKPAVVTPEQTERNHAAIVIQRRVRCVYGFAAPVRSETCLDADIMKKVCSVVAQWHQSTVTHTTAVEQLLQMLVRDCFSPQHNGAV